MNYTKEQKRNKKGYYKNSYCKCGHKYRDHDEDGSCNGKDWRWNCFCEEFDLDLKWERKHGRYVEKKLEV